MPENVAVHEIETGGTPLTRHERRHIRRVGVTLQVRIRTADGEDGDFEEVRTTLNASKKAIYFFTPLNGYYKGMKLGVTFPYDANASTNLEQVGKVVRVHRRGTGFGVAVALTTGSEGEQTSAYAQAAVEPVVIARQEETKSKEERRCAKRSSFIAPVELIDMRSGTRVKARLADLSLHGCYVDTLNPLPAGAAVRLQVHRGEEMLEVMARVTSQHPGSGMGLEFSGMTLEHRATLRSWLAECSGGTEAIVPSPRFSGNGKHPDGVEEPYAVRLINALVRKGILSKSEATELLRDPES